MALIDFTLSNARRFYWSMGNPLGWKGLMKTFTILTALTLLTAVVVFAHIQY